MSDSCGFLYKVHNLLLIFFSFDISVGKYATDTLQYFVLQSLWRTNTFFFFKHCRKRRIALSTFPASFSLVPRKTENHLKTGKHWNTQKNARKCLKICSIKQRTLSWEYAGIAHI